MNQNRSRLLTVRAAAILLLAALLLSACRAAGPATLPAASTTPTATATLTRTPTRTPVPSATVTPSPTPTPALFDVQLQKASELRIQWGSTKEFDDYLDVGGTRLMIGVENYPDSVVYIHDARTGQEIWSYSVPGRIWLDYFVTQQYLFLIENGPDSSGWSELHTYSLPSMQEVWTRRFQSEMVNLLFANPGGLIVWQEEQDADDKLYQLAPQDGTQVWQQDIPDNARCYDLQYYSLFYYERKLRLQCWDSVLYLDFASGEMLQREPAQYEYPVYAGSGVVYLDRRMGDDRALYAFNLADPLHPKKLWSISFKGGFGFVAAYDGDAVYVKDNLITRLDQRTGEVKWQTAVNGYALGGIRVVGPRLFVGSGVGFLYLLDADSGELLWQQDIWGSFEPRYKYVNAMAVTSEGLYLKVSGSFLANGVMFLGFEGAQALATPTRRATSTPSPVPTSTPVLTFVPPAPGELPAPPKEREQWAAAIMFYLNAAPQNLASLGKVFDYWSDLEQNGWVRHELKQADLTQDGQKELYVLLDGYLWGMVLVLQPDAAGVYQPLYYRQDDGAAQFQSFIDLDRDGQLEFVYNSIFNGVHTATTTVVPLKWDGAQWIDLSTEPMCSTTVDVVKVQNLVGDAQVEILIHGGTYGSTSAGPNRNSAFIYSLVDGRYSLYSQKPDPDNHEPLYFSVYDANALLVAGDAEGAARAFEKVLASPAARAPGLHPQPAHIYAFAEYQLVLAYVLLGDETQAERWATSGHYPDAVYSQIKTVFWETYVESHDWATAAEAARTRARLAGYEAIQLLPYIGYGTDELDLDSICPCETCKDGYIAIPGRL